jgi:sigma-54 dependent transcriptional regulator, acetoin dehydrogenase operon transcriptional activator AcoR
MLVLTEPSAQYRESFLAGELSVRDPLRDRWERVRGVRAEGDGSVQAVSAGELHERRDRLESLLRAERSLLAPIARDLAARSLVAVIADRDGVVLHRHGGGAFSDKAELVRLIEGACWSEAVRGTNAIGTALLEQRPIGVLGGAHFEQKNAGLFCYCAPVHDVHGDVVCALDVSGPVAAHDAAVSVAVRAASSALELALRTHAFQDVVEGGLSALARIVERVREPAFVIDMRGEVLLENGPARPLLQQLGHSSASPYLPRHLTRWKLAAGGVVDEGAFRLTLEPIASHSGRILALLVVARSSDERSAVVPSVEAPAFREILGTDASLVREKERAQAFARSELPVLLLAETGTGKELFARAIHASSTHAGGPFVALNCAALNDTLLEAELFGHAPHAFTGANRQGAPGKLAAADGGTLFLDELADMPPSMQSALLRFLDDGSYYRVGENKPRHAKVRVIAATCRDLPTLVREGRFRQDLFYRVQGACVRPPPLRERSDRVWLAERLLGRTRPASLTRSAAAYVGNHSWPGNVRELKSALEHALALASGHLLDRSHFPEPLLTLEPTRVAEPVRSREVLLREAVDEALRVTHGNLSEAARRLNMARSTLYRILHKS